jgi:hypothetical protein
VLKMKDDVHDEVEGEASGAGVSQLATACA